MALQHTLPLKTDARRRMRIDQHVDIIVALLNERGYTPMDVWMNTEHPDDMEVLIIVPEAEYFDRHFSEAYVTVSACEQTWREVEGGDLRVMFCHHSESLDIDAIRADGYTTHHPIS